MNADTSLVGSIMSKALEESIVMVLCYVRGGWWKRLSGWDGSHLGWEKEKVSLVLDAEGVPEL